MAKPMYKHEAKMTHFNIYAMLHFNKYRKSFKYNAYNSGQI